MLNILSSAFGIATRTENSNPRISQEERHQLYMLEERRKRRALEAQRDRAFYRRS